ncbi:MAG: 4Fe-4S dicluster domain-containing protein [Bacteroidia bacterium]|nr:4Fe-4S dicluster domain-containing protein [Bacteroidia bacterium]
MLEIKQKARELLESGKAQVVIGYGKGPNNTTRAIFVRKPEDADKLVLDDTCVQNLALYIYKHEVRHFGKEAVVATLPVLRSLLQLASENQVKDNEIIAIAITPDNKVVELDSFAAIEEHVRLFNTGLTEDEKDLLKKINAMGLEERWAFWNKEFSKCIKCYACRQSCPMCYCPRCAAEVNQPQWIPVAAHQHGNIEWHIMRAMHLAGRCINCGDCARACPVDIPLNLLTYNLIEELNNEFKYTAGLSASQTYVLSTWKLEDKETFIR